MNIIYAPNYKKENTIYWCIHHFGGTASNPLWSSQHQTLHDIDTAHKSRWPSFCSELGYWVGYNFIISKYGEITQCRKIGEETAAQKGYNFNGQVISICFAGNFIKGVDAPTAEQIAAFRRLANELPRVKFLNIKPHWFFNQTDCYGTGLSEGWARGLVPELDERGNLQILLNSIQAQINEIMRLLKTLKLSGKKPSCEETARG